METTTIRTIIENLITINNAKNNSLMQLLINYKELSANGNYLLLYKNIAGYLAHAEGDQFTYNKLSEILNILENDSLL